MNSKKEFAEGLLAMNWWIYLDLFLVIQFWQKVFLICFQDCKMPARLTSGCISVNYIVSQITIIREPMKTEAESLASSKFWQDFGQELSAGLCRRSVSLTLSWCHIVVSPGCCSLPGHTGARRINYHEEIWKKSASKGCVGVKSALHNLGESQCLTCFSTDN